MVAAAQVVEVQWSAPRECPGRELVLDMVQARARARQAAEPLHAQATVTRDGAGYRLELELESRGGHARRSLHNAQCGALAEAAAVLIVLALEPEQGRDAEPVLSPSADIAITHEDEAERAAARALHLQLSAAARADVGTFPQQPAWGVQAQLAARYKPLYAALGVTYWPAHEQRSESYPNARLRGSGLFADLGLGLDVTTRPVVLTPTLDVELGLLYAEALGIAGPERNRMLWVAFGPSVATAISVLPDLWLSLELSGLIPVYRTHWLVRTPQADVPAFDASPLVLRVALRVSYTLR